MSQDPTHPIRSVALAALVWAFMAQAGHAATLVGSQVTYTSDFPNPGSVLSSLGTQTVAAGTLFDDTAQGLRSFFVGNQLVIQNTVPLAFATAPFNGPQFQFSGGIAGASVNAASSADFLGAVSTGADSVQANFSAFTPAVGSTELIDLTSGAPLAGQQVTYDYRLPDLATLHASIGPAPFVDTTAFLDNADGILVAVGANTITIVNLVPLAFAGGAFNGPNLTFSGVDIAGASIDPSSATDFLGQVNTTQHGLTVNFAGLAPALGHALVLDVSAIAVPEPASWALMIVGSGLAGAGLRRRRAQALAA
jgi:hypothetical protein